MKCVIVDHQGNLHGPFDRHGEARTWARKKFPDVADGSENDDVEGPHWDIQTLCAPD